VPAGDVQQAFAQAAAADGIVLTSTTFDWLNEQGHVGLERVAQSRRDTALHEPVTAAIAPLAAIYARLKGDASVLPAARENLLLPVQLFHEPSQTVIEVDDLSHFTSFRLTTLELYPPGAALGFDRAEHMQLCRDLAATTDRIDRGLAAKGFGFGGLPRERAYRDALFDLAVPAMGHAPVIRMGTYDHDRLAAALSRR
jgi:hypothetical protein